MNLAKGLGFITFSEGNFRRKIYRELSVYDASAASRSKIKGLPDLIFLCRTQAKCHNARHYRTFCIIGLASG
jgi:hypothetical protein